ncbi:MAG: PIG-L deacetylase family protein [Actinomycetota bacterium]|nr:PIG-L family deacetylase [Actinomycetota bacterium]
MADLLPDLGTILGVWAHPDDETYTSGGIMALAAKEGRRVACLTATDGDQGSWDAKRWPHGEALAVIRQGELQEALRILGVSELVRLGYPDGRCSEVDEDEAISKIVEVMRQVKPDSVLTFGPDGATGHPDHKAVSRWATEAFRLAAPLGSRLYHAAITQAWVDKYLEKINEFDVFPNGAPVTAVEDLAIDFTLPDELNDLKVKALKAHLSQVEGMIQSWGTEFMYQGNRDEVFRLAEHKLA